MTTSRWTWLQLGAALVVVAALAAAWRWTSLPEWTAPERLSDALEPYRTRWVGLPLVIGLFVVGELLLFPVLVLVFVCGLAFGPWLGTAYAMTGAVASAVLPFFIGRWIGRQRLVRWGGAPARRLARSLDRKGVVAVYLVRKLPAPFTPVNMLCGACGLSLVDFLLGTFFGMATGIVLITVFGSQIGSLLADPRPAQLFLAAGFLLGTFALALYVQQLLNRRLGPGA